MDEVAQGAPHERAVAPPGPSLPQARDDAPGALVVVYAGRGRGFDSHPPTYRVEVVEVSDLPQ